jgi:hypothetical protein
VTRRSSKRVRVEKTSPPSRRKIWLTLLGAGLFGGVVAGGAFYYRAEKRATQARSVEEQYVQWTDRTARIEAASDTYFRCVTGPNTRPVRDAKRLKKVLAQHNRGDYAGFGQRVRTSCSPPMDKLLKELASVAPVPPELTDAWSQYLASLRVLLASLQGYADRAARHAEEDSSHAEIVEVAETWSKTADQSSERGRLERFLACAAPGLVEAKNKEALMVWIAKECVNANPSAYMQRIRDQCRPYLGASNEGVALSSDMTAALKRYHAERIGPSGVVPMMLAACTEAVRREWVEADAGPVVNAAVEYFTRKQTFGTAVHRLAPRRAD